MKASCYRYDQVLMQLRRINPWKAAGPNNIAGCVLKECADQLAYVFTYIFNTSLSQVVVPICFKKATITPVPKKHTCHCLNDYRPIPLTPIIIKCSKSLLRDHIKSKLPLSLSGVLQQLFHLSLNQERILVLLKTSCLISVPKNWTPSGLSDYRPAALRPFLVHLRPHIKSLLAVSTFTPRWTWQHCENH